MDACSEQAVGSGYRPNFKTRPDFLRLGEVLALYSNLAALITFIAKSGRHPGYMEAKTASLPVPNRSPTPLRCFLHLETPFHIVSIVPQRL